MQRQGFYATGLNQLLTESGAPKGSLYFHFPGGKEQVAAEAVADARERFRAGIERAIGGAASAGEVVRNLVRAMADGLESSGYVEGCPIATVALETSATSEALRSACRAAFRSWEDAIAARLEQFGWEQDAARSFAVVLLAALEGGLLLARTERDVSPLLTVGEQLARLAEQGDGVSG